MSTLRGLTKRAARFVASTAAPWVWRGLPGPRLLILMYHRVLPTGHAARSYEQAGMIVSPDTLRMQLRQLRKHFELVHLDDWVNRSLSGASLPRLACALTFDDGWRDNHEFAFPVLCDLQAPATVYLVSDLVGGTYGFWPTRMSRVLEISRSSGRADVAALLQRRTGVPFTAVDGTIAALKSRHDDAGLQAIAAELETALGIEATPDLMSWEQIAEMHASGLVRFGSHTRRHTRLRDGLPADTAVDEILGSSVEIEQRLGVPVEGFCYPNGDHCPEVVDLVASRYTYAVTTRQGWNGANSDLALLRRVGVHDDVSDTPRKFIARLALGI